MATGGLYGQSPTGALIAQPGTETTGLYGKSPNGSVIAQPGSESSGLYGGSPNFGGSYFEWFVFQVSASQPATPTGGSWSFTSNTGTPPSGWSNAPANAPTNPVWISIGLVNSRSNTPIVWSTPGVFSYSGQLNGSGAPTSGIGIDGTFYIQTGVSPYAIWFKNSGTWVQVTGAALYVALTGDQTIGGTKTFSSLIQGSISGNAATATSATTAATATYATTAGSATTAGTATYATSAGSVPYSGLTGAVPTWNQNTTGNAATADYATNAGFATNANAAVVAGNVTGVVAIANGGTGASDATTARTNLGLGSAAVLTAGAALGVATLDAGGTVPLSQIPASIQGGVSYQGTWNATTNSPTLNSSVGTKGYYYVVSVAGSTNLNGITNWNIGDWAIFNGTAWEKIDNTDAVTSVNGQTGTVVLTASDIGGLGTMAVQNANAVAITGGNESGVTHSGDIIGTHLDYTPGAAPSYAEGRTWYDSTAKALAYYNDVSGVQIHIGHDLQFKVINNTGSTIPNGSPVYITGTSSGQTYPNVALARADVAATATVIGLTDGAIANGAAGYVTSIGNIDNVNTGMFTVGQVLYLSPYSAGQLMNTIPPTGITVQVGMVTFVNSSTGKIYVKQTTPLNVPASIISGTVAIANGGTGASTAAGARTNLGLGTIATQNFNAVDIEGGTIDSTAIGGTTPAAGTFTTLTATGQTSLGGVAGSEGFRAYVPTTAGAWLSTRATAAAVFLGNEGTTLPFLVNTNQNSFSIRTGTLGGVSEEQLRVTRTASAVNYVQVTGAATTASPVISVQGSDTNVNLGFVSKGSGEIRFASNANGSNINFRVLHTTSSAVNYGTVTGAVAGSAPVFGVAGTDTNIPLVLQPKGTGAIDLAAGSSGVNISNGGTVTAITRTGAGTGYTSPPAVAITAPTTANGVQATATVNLEQTSSTSIIAGGGTGYTINDVITVVGGTQTTPSSYTVTSVSGGVITGLSLTQYGSYSAIPSNPVSVTGGTGTGATLTITWQIKAAFTITNAGSGYVEQPTVSFSGGGGSGAAAYATVGAATQIKTLGGSSTTGLSFYTPVGEQVRIANIGDGTRPILIFGGGAGGSAIGGMFQPTSTAQLGLSTNTGSVSFFTGGQGATEQARVSHTASAVNYVQVTGAATGGTSSITFTGSDANVTGAINTKGSGSFSFYSGSGAGRQVRIDGSSTTASNYLDFYGAVAGAAPSVRVGGSDTNIDLTLTPKGTGNVRFGTYTANMALTVQGYIEIKDSGGTVRRLAVVA